MGRQILPVCKRITNKNLIVWEKLLVKRIINCDWHQQSHLGEFLDGTNEIILSRKIQPPIN